MKGIFKILDDISKVQCHNIETFVQNIETSWKNSSIIAKPKPRSMERNLGFVVCHFSGDVLYNAVSLIPSLIRISITRSIIYSNSCKILFFHCVFKNNFLEKNLDIIPNAVKSICSDLSQLKMDARMDGTTSSRNAERSASKTLKMGTDDLVYKMSETVRSIFEHIHITILVIFLDLTNLFNLYILRIVHLSGVSSQIPVKNVTSLMNLSYYLRSFLLVLSRTTS